MPRSRTCLAQLDRTDLVHRVSFSHALDAEVGFHHEVYGRFSARYSDNGSIQEMGANQFRPKSNPSPLEMPRLEIVM